VCAIHELTSIQIFFGEGDLGQGQAWADHNSGEQSLVLSGYPHMYSKGEAHQVFIDGRLHLVRVTNDIYPQSFTQYA